MQPTRLPIRRLAGRPGTVAAAGVAVLLGLAAGLKAQERPDYQPQATIAEVMNSMVMPFTQAVWDAIVYEDAIRGPETDEGWQKVRDAAVALAESANVLMIPGRAVARSEDLTPEGELSPQEIEDLIARKRGAWVDHARALHEAATQAIQAIDARDAEELSNVGGTLNSVCQDCHLEFWYPNQR